jgi:molybdenum cofactor biosynthesis enzyme MoaA
MSLNNQTFCSAPWFQVRIDWDGTFRPCCQLTDQTEFQGQTRYSQNTTSVDQWMTSDYSTYLRTQLTQGNKLTECSKCWTKEDNGLRSLRQTINDTVTGNNGDQIDNTWVRLFVGKNTTFDNYLLKSADVKLSNVCNFSCAMCSPQDSSKILDRWESDLSAGAVKTALLENPTYLSDIRQTYKLKRGYQHLNDILTQPITHLKLLGGEPLIDKDLFNILTAVPKEKQANINLHFVTNGSQSLTNAAYILEKYKSISFTISLEGIGDTQDYIRSGSKWSDIEKNVLEARQQGLLVTVNHTLQALSVINLYQLVEWTNAHDIPLNITTLEDPDYLSVGVLPVKIRKLAVDNLQKIKSKILNDAVLDVDKIINVINNIPDMTKLHQKFVDYVLWYEKKTTKTLREICPKCLSS